MVFTGCAISGTERGIREDGYDQTRVNIDHVATLRQARYADMMDAELRPDTSRQHPHANRGADHPVHLRADRGNPGP